MRTCPTPHSHGLTKLTLSLDIYRKSNRLEFYVFTPNGLSLQHSRAVYGRVTMLNKFRPVRSATDFLFVGTDRYMYFALSWDPETKRLRTERSFVDQADKSARDSQTGDRCCMDPNGRYMALELYEGVVTILPVTQKPDKTNQWQVGDLQEPIQVRVPEMFVRSTTFFESRIKTKENKANLALLHEDTQRNVRLKIRPVTYTGALRGAPGDVDLDNGAESLHHDLELGATHLIPVPEPACESQSLLSPCMLMKPRLNAAKVDC